MCTRIKDDRERHNVRQTGTRATSETRRETRNGPCVTEPRAGTYFFILVKHARPVINNGQSCGSNRAHVAEQRHHFHHQTSMLPKYPTKNICDGPSTLFIATYVRRYSHLERSQSYQRRVQDGKDDAQGNGVVSAMTTMQGRTKRQRGLVLVGRYLRRSCKQTTIHTYCCKRSDSGMQADSRAACSLTHNTQVRRACRQTRKQHNVNAEEGFNLRSSCRSCPSLRPRTT